MEKQKKKLTISGKSKKINFNIKNFEDKRKPQTFEKKFSKPLNKFSSNFKKSFKSKPVAPKLSDYEKRKLAEQKVMKGIRGDNNQKEKENKTKYSTKKIFQNL